MFVVKKDDKIGFPPYIVAVANTFEEALHKMADLMDTAVGPDWDIQTGWGYFDEVGNEYGIFEEEAR